MEKMVIGSSGQCLEDSVIDIILMEYQVFGPGLITLVLSLRPLYTRKTRNDDTCGSYATAATYRAFDQSTKIVRESQKAPKCSFWTGVCRWISIQWESCKKEKRIIFSKLDKSITERKESSTQFQHWIIYPQKIYAVLSDLTTSYREKNKNLYSSAVHRTITLIFEFDRVNYKRWATTMDYEDCLAIKENFPQLDEAFMDSALLCFKLEKILKNNFIEIALQHGCSPVNLSHIFWTPFPKNTSGGLFLNIPINFEFGNG